MRSCSSRPSGVKVVISNRRFHRRGQSHPCPSSFSRGDVLTEAPVPTTRKAPAAIAPAVTRLRPARRRRCGGLVWSGNGRSRRRCSKLGRRRGGQRRAGATRSKENHGGAGSGKVSCEGGPRATTRGSSKPRAHLPGSQLPPFCLAAWASTLGAVEARVSPMARVRGARP